MKSYKKYYSPGSTITKDVDMGTKTVSGFYNTFSVNGREIRDSDGDILMPGSFKKSIQENGPQGANRILHLRQHSAFDVIGIPVVLEEKTVNISGNMIHGVYFETKIPDTTLGLDTIKLYQAGILKEHSVGIIPLKEEPTQEGNRIYEVKMLEGSTVTWGANEHTPFAGFKGISINNDKTEEENIMDLISKVANELDRGSYQDDTFKQLEIALEQLKSELKSLKLDRVPGSATPGSTIEPTDVDINLVSIFAKSLNF